MKFRPEHKSELQNLKLQMTDTAEYDHFQFSISNNYWTAMQFTWKDKKSTTSDNRKAAMLEGIRLKTSQFRSWWKWWRFTFRIISEIHIMKFLILCRWALAASWSSGFPLISTEASEGVDGLCWGLNGRELCSSSCGVAKKHPDYHRQDNFRIEPLQVPSSPPIPLQSPLNSTIVSN